MNYTEIIGYFAAFNTTVAFLPQAIKILKTRRTQDISLIMYIVLIIGLLSWLIYGLLAMSYPIIIANTITLIEAFLILWIKASNRIKHGEQ